MRIFKTSVALGALALILVGAGFPAPGQDKPESILPPGFGDPVTTPPPPPGRTPTPAPAPAPAQDSPPATAPAPPPPRVPPLAVPGAAPGAPVPPAEPPRYEMPAHARRSLAVVGIVDADARGLGIEAFGDADGNYVQALMRSLDAPLASRWLSILLRRTLVAQIATPPQINGADFAAERAWLLLRMGESVAARGVVQSVDSDNYTPKLLQIAMQAALATGDPGGLCPVVEEGAKLKAERGWVLARAMCAGLSGNVAQAKAIIGAARKAGLANGVDLLLAEKIAGVGRQAVTIEWDSVDRLTAWRFGLATASAVEIPESLAESAGPQVRSWRALSPGYEPGARIAAADYAAARGVLSNAALVDLYGVIEAAEDQASGDVAVARDLRSAYAAQTAAARYAALVQLWDEPAAPDTRLARLILTARAAARLPRQTEGVDVDRLVAAMLTAGLDRSALRWRDRAARGTTAWALLALADPDARTLYSLSDVRSYSGGTGDAPLARRMLFAGLAGLSRIDDTDIASGAEALKVRIGDQNDWTRAIDRAARRKQPGLVVLLAGIGMQTRDWSGVPPEILYHTVRALRAVGLEGEARMIAAEAIARL